MAALFFDGERLVTRELMLWVAESKEPRHQWALRDTDDGIEFFATKAAAKARLAEYAAEEGVTL